MNKKAPQKYLNKINSIEQECNIENHVFQPNAGCHTDAVYLGDDLVALFSNNGERGSFHRTLEVSNCIRESISLNIPKALVVEDDFVIMEKFQGQSLTKKVLQNIEQKQKEYMADQLGEFIVQMHSINQNQLSHLNLSDQSQQYSKAEIEKNFEEMLKIVSPHVRMGHVNASLRSHFMSWFESEQHRDCEPVLCHGELAPVHIFTNARNVTGIVDFGEAHLGDPASDLLFLIWGYGQGFVDLMVKHHPSLQDKMKRARFLFGYMMLDWLKRGISNNQPEVFTRFLSIPMDFDWL
jgi:aminoglycoside 2''-phosphotransferase